MAGLTGYPLFRLLFLVAFSYGCYAALLFLTQRSIIYPGRSIRPSAVMPPASAEIVRIWLESGEGKVEAWFLPGRGVTTGRSPAVLFFHGNGEIIDFLPEQVEQLRNWGIGVMLVEFPGYGRSSGTPSEASITSTAVAAYDALLKRSDVDPRRIIAFGRSLGCGAACALSRTRELAGMILHAPFTSLRDFAPRFLLPPFLVRDVFDNRSALAAYRRPVLILHGTRDNIIPVAHGRELARTARNARLIEMDCAHNDCPPDPRTYWPAIGKFLATLNGLP